MPVHLANSNPRPLCWQLSRRVIVTVFILLAFFPLVSSPLPGRQALAVEGAEGPPVVFYAMGDVPYIPEEDKLLPRQIAEIPDDAQFLVHLGDIKDGATPCDETIYQKVASMLAKSKVPTFIIPGDNEWNDCQKPDQGWKYWQKHFRRFDQRWKHDFQLSRSKKHDENFVFVHRQVLFVGLNLVGGRVHDPQEWKSRHRDNLDWTTDAIKQHGKQVHAMVILAHANPQPSHDDFFKPLVTAAQQFAKPILYLHGDGHRWIKDQPWEAKNILRVQVDQGGKAPPLKITIHKNPAETFQFDRRK
jgi:hypothetical protein